MTAVVLDELDGGRPAGLFCFHARLGLVELHGLDVRRDLALADHADRLRSSWSSLVELQCIARRGNEEGCCAHG